MVGPEGGDDRLKRFEQYCVGCALTQNMEWSKRTFEGLCPAEYSVGNGRPLKTEGEYPCRWEVEYLFRDHDATYEIGPPARSVIEQLRGLHPLNAECLGWYQSVVPPAFVLHYAVRCDCHDSDQGLENRPNDEVNIFALTREDFQ